MNVSAMTYPNYRNKYREEAVFSPGDWVEYRKKHGKMPDFNVPAGIIFCVHEGLLQHVINHYETDVVKGFFGKLLLLKDTGDQVGVMGGFGIGAPAITILTEELIARGTKKFIILGKAGALQEHLKIGDTVVCSRAIRDEGTSHHYLKPGKYAYPSEPLKNRIENRLKKFGFNYTAGTTWTTDAPYRETVAEVKRYQDEGVLTVEMEAAALFAVARFRLAEAAALFNISDHLDKLKWEPRFHLSGKYLQKLFPVTVEALMMKAE